MLSNSIPNLHKAVEIDSLRYVQQFSNKLEFRKIVHGIIFRTYFRVFPTLTEQVTVQVSKYSSVRYPDLRYCTTRSLPSCS